MSKPTVLHLGDPIKYNPDTYALLAQKYTVLRPSTEERQRPAFLQALRERKWGDFSAMFRPFWGTGGEMGNWDAELIGALPSSVRVFSSAGAGFDWVDTETLGKRGIIYCNGGLAAAESVADFAVAMVISTFRHFPWATAAALLPNLTPAPSAGGPNNNNNNNNNDNTAAAAAAAEDAFKFSHTHTTAHSRNLRAHTLGVIGLGKIGQMIAKKLGNPTMGMRVAYTDLFRLAPAVEEACYHAAFYDTLEDLLGASDVVVICIPAGPPVINRESLRWLKKGARVVNVARGSLVDENALADALEQGIVSTAALDVHGDEPRVSSRLVKFAGGEVLSPEIGSDGHGVNPGRVLLTCHNAGGTVETHIGFEELAMRNVMGVLGGGAAVTPVNMHFLKGESKL